MGEIVGERSFSTLSQIYTGYGDNGPTQGLFTFAWRGRGARAVSAAWITWILVILWTTGRRRRTGRRIQMGSCMRRSRRVRKCVFCVNGVSAPRAFVGEPSASSIKSVTPHITVTERKRQ